MEQNPIVTGMQWQLEVIQQQLAQQEKDRTQDKIEKLEKKYAEAKREVKEARDVKNNKVEKQSGLCIIQ
jgi:hypothetical protein